MGPGEHIGRYVVEELLGEGGMGQVYRAYDATLNRRVAIKLLRADSAETTADTVRASGDDAVPSAARVVREARMAAALDHPNVVSIFDVGEQGGTPFIVMELVNGRSLRVCVGDPSIPVTERVHWLLGIARALSAAHRVGLVHRDVKPENVLVRDDGVVKVLDFGIARLQPRHSQRPPPEGNVAIALPPVSAESTLAGTPAYMAPEQIRRQNVDPRVDQFAWGVVAYELLTGALPWATDPRSMAVLLAVLERQPPRLSSAGLGVAESFVSTVHRALEKAREARFASMDDLLLATGLAFSNGEIPMPGPIPSVRLDSSSKMKLRSDLTSAPTLLATQSATALVRPAAPAGHRDRKRRAYVLGGASFAVITGLVAVRQWSARGDVPSRPPEAPPVAAVVFTPHDARRLTFDPGCEEYPSFAPDAKTVVFDSSVGDDIQIVALDTATGVQRSLTEGAGSHYAPAVSPDGKTVAYLLQNGDEVATWLVPFDGASAPRKLLAGRLRPSWSPDGRAIWAGAVDRPTRMDLVTETSTRTLEPPDGYHVLRTRELADGRVIARLLDRPTRLGRGLVLYPKDSNTSSPLFPDDTEDAIGVSRDGLSLFVPKFLASTSRVELWHVPLGGGVPSIVPGHVVLPTKGLDFAPDGSKVVWSTCSTEQDMARLESSAQVVGRPAGRVDEMQASPLFQKTEWTDDQPAGIGTTKMVVVSDRVERRQLWILDLAAKEAPRHLPLGSVVAASPAVSPDESWIAFAAVGSGIEIVAVDGQSSPRRLTSGDEDGSPAFSVDGRWVLFHTASGHGRAIARVPVGGASPPEVLIADGEYPATSPSSDTLVYLAGEGEVQRPMLYDLRARTSRPLSAALAKGVYLRPKFSTDGMRVALGVGLNDVVEVDVATGRILRKFASSDQVTSLTYVGPDIVISREAWRGDVWMALDPWGRRAGAQTK